MDISAMTAAALQMTQSSQREGISLMMIKQAAESGQKIAGMLDALIGQQQPDPSYNVSLYV